VNWPSLDRWAALWRKAGATGAAGPWYERLTAAYSEPQRHYHNQRHIAECLAEFDQARHLARQPTAVELALWFHDVVYDPKASDNEEQSAELAVRCLADGGISGAAAQAVVKLVLGTKTHDVDADSDTALVVDVDLSILGQDEKRFFEYEEQIRREYAWVPQSIFASKRVEILQGFLARERIFTTEWFYKYEGAARRNLQASIARLSA
jgi:predicted metal-dependent HD superfamily phosphohydrolase